MKTTAIIKIGVLTLAVLAILCTPLMTLTVNAQAYSSYTGAHNAIAYLAEKEIRDNELKTRDKQNVTLVAKTEAVTDPHGDEDRPEHSVNQENEKENR